MFEHTTVISNIHIKRFNQAADDMVTSDRLHPNAFI